MRSRDATVASSLAAFAVELERDAIPAAVLEAARLHLLDALGCGLAACGLEAAPYARATAAAAAGGPASAIGVAGGREPAAAALANGISCHALDFDDTHGASISHVSTVVVPATIAAAQAVGANHGALISALVVGNEVTCRVGEPAGDAFHLRGLHATAFCGVFGATAAVGRLHGVSASTLVSALGIAGSMAAGLLAYLTDGSDTKRIHPGWMAHAAHHAVALARGGASGPAAVIEGPAGIYRGVLGRDDLALSLDDLGVRWCTPEIAIKPYPSCHFMHAALDATNAIRSRTGLSPADVARVTVFAPQAAAEMVLDPIERKRRPETPYEAKFSTPYAIGALLVHGRVDVTTFTPDAIVDSEALALAEKVDWELRAYETFPASFSGGVRIVLVDGSEHEEHVLHERGGPRAPLPAEDVVAKFRANADVALPLDARTALERFLLGAEPDAPLDELRLLERAAVAA